MNNTSISRSHLQLCARDIRESIKNNSVDINTIKQQYRLLTDQWRLLHPDRCIGNYLIDVKRMIEIYDQ